LTWRFAVGDEALKQSVKFLNPVFIDNPITTTAAITVLRAKRGIVTFKTMGENQDAEIVATNEAVVFHENAKAAAAN
jgi:acyl dehydratase